MKIDDGVRIGGQWMKWKMKDKMVENVWECQLKKENCKQRVNAQRDSDEKCMKNAFLSPFTKK